MAGGGVWRQQQGQACQGLVGRVQGALGPRRRGRREGLAMVLGLSSGSRDLEGMSCSLESAESCPRVQPRLRCESLAQAAC